MGRVRFYELNGDKYVTLRVEDDGLYLLGSKLREHKERVELPPKSKQVVGRSVSSVETYADLKDPDLAEKILAVFNDIEETIGLDPEAMASVKSAYKATGIQFGIKYRGSWTNYAGENILVALLTYWEEVLKP